MTERGSERGTGLGRKGCARVRVEEREWASR